MYKVDINSDLGESFGNYKIGNDEAVMKYISSANIACGFHAGDPLIMEKTVKLALENNVAIGAHPGYPDLNGFGRRNMNMSSEELTACVKYQVSALKGIAESLGATLQHVKPHGAMYNQAASNYKMAFSIAKAIAELNTDLIYMGLANSEMEKAALDIGIPFASEVFADRAYTNEGHLVPRSQEGAVIHDDEFCKKRTLNMVKDGEVVSIDNNLIRIKADTICIHGDNPAALAMAKSIYEHFKLNQVEIKSLK